jgi:hypothetical protein
VTLNGRQPIAKRTMASAWIATQSTSGKSVVLNFSHSPQRFINDTTPRVGNRFNGISMFVIYCRGAQNYKHY